MSEIALLIILMALVTYLPRVLPMLLLSRRTLPRAAVLWLSYVPVAVLAALLAPASLLLPVS
jgi:branched-subunit amino acid transport protein